MIEILVWVVIGVTLLIAVDIFEDVRALRKSHAVVTYTDIASFIYRAVGFIFGLMVVAYIVATA